jgi:hypothetical protein
MSFWMRFGLSRSPFFQEPLEHGTPQADLERFFVGREDDRNQMLSRLTHDTQTRVVMVGDPGVGKTTLMNRVVADLRQGDSNREPWGVPELKPINLPGAATLQDFCLEVLRHALDVRRHFAAAEANQQRGAKLFVTKAANVGRAAKKAVAPTKAFWEGVERLVDGATFLSPQFMGAGLNVQHLPPTLSSGQWVPLASEALNRLVAETGADVLLSVNNAENMARESADQASHVLRDARDLFLIPNVHWLFVGTPDFVDNVVRPLRQVAGIMQDPFFLRALKPNDVRDLLARRYAELAVPNTVLIPPVDLDAVVTLARVFAGDLRELLGALESTVLRVMYKGAITLTERELVQLVSVQQGELLKDRMKGAAWAHLVRVVVGDADQPGLIQRFREADAVRRLKPMKQASVHGHKKTWLANRLVYVDGHTGASEWLRVSGAALLAMLPEATAAGKDLSAYHALRDLEVAEVAPIDSADQTGPTSGSGPSRPLKA